MLYFLGLFFRSLEPQAILAVSRSHHPNQEGVSCLFCSQAVGPAGFSLSRGTQYDSISHIEQP